jgi:hypothetical protein
VTGNDDDDDNNNNNNNNTWTLIFWAVTPCILAGG